MVKGARGMFSDDIVYKRVRGKLVLAKAPSFDEDRELTEKQKARVRFFQKAVKYADIVEADPDLRALYQTGITLKKYTARHVAMSDYFNAPRIERVDTSKYRGQPGETIIIEATDDFMVDEVSVTIADSLGTELERGVGIKNPRGVDEWIYTATVANSSLPGTKITIAAKDKAGNVTTGERVL